MNGWLVRFVTVLFLGICAEALHPAALAWGDVGPRAYRVAVTVDAGAVADVYTPCSVDIDFGALLVKAGEKGRFAPDSVLVMLVEEDGREVVVPHAMDEGFAWADKGLVLKQA